MKDRRRGLDPVEFLVRYRRTRQLGVFLFAALALYGLYALSG
jgi:hypothetical protein